MASRGDKERLDAVLVARGLVPSRTRAQALILAGRVSCEGQRLDKPGLRVALDAPLEVRPGRQFVGRGALKLAGALDCFDVNPAGRVALDVGASTGGFTQVLLERGARRVLALDVGKGQLDWSLRRDPRVSVLEGVNARHLEPARLPETPGLATIDVSFISTRLVLPAVVRCLAPGGEVVTLIKPQFEAGRGRVGKGGVVRDPALHREVVERAMSFADEQGWALRGVCASPLPGAEGNREFFLHLQPQGIALGAAERARALTAALASAGHEERR
jgi:23S rRNA (cytidine1920-2'-O)/16S rRNA (cytidine1409-2'-O)-methyltransferase